MWKLDSFWVLSLGYIVSLVFVTCVWQALVVREAIRAAKEGQSSNVAATTLPIFVVLISLLGSVFIALLLKQR